MLFASRRLGLSGRSAVFPGRLPREFASGIRTLESMGQIRRLASHRPHSPHSPFKPQSPPVLKKKVHIAQNEPAKAEGIRKDLARMQSTMRWDDVPAELRRNWTALGWSQKLWDAEGPMSERQPSSMNRSWNELRTQLAGYCAAVN